MTNETEGPAIIALGLDERRKARAGVFGGDAAQAAAGRARDLRLVVVPVDGEALLALSAELPRGDLTKEGVGFLPVVSRALYERALAAAGVTGSGRQGGKGNATEGRKQADPQRRLPASWAEISVDDLVLAEDHEPGNGWYEAVVLETLPGDVLRLRFRDYPSEPEVIRNVDQLALMHPKIAST
jgi:hypothetical protein